MRSKLFIVLCCVICSTSIDAQIITNGAGIISNPVGVARQHSLVNADGGPMLRVTNPQLDSLRDEITKLRRQLEEMTTQLKRLEGASGDSAGVLTWRFNSSGENFGLDGLSDSDYVQRFRNGFDLHGSMPEPPHEFRFNDKPIVPPFPNYEYRIPAPSVPHLEPKPSTPNPDFPGWKVQWLGGWET